MSDELKVVIIAGPMVWPETSGLWRKNMTLKKPAPKDPDLANVEKALKRAAKAAHDLARETHTPCYVVKRGKIVNVAESQSDYKAARKNSTGGSGEQGTPQ